MKIFHIATLTKTLPFLALPLVASLLPGCGQSFNQQIAGHYASTTCEPAGPGTFVKRDFVLTESTWQIDVGVYNDASCAAKFVGIGVSGPYEVKQPSTVVAGATEVDYIIQKHTITPATDAALQTLNGGNCGPAPRAIGQAVDVTGTGCAPLMIPSVATCPRELDLNQLDGSNLFFGDRSSDLCKARPSKLGTSPVVKM